MMAEGMLNQLDFENHNEDLNDGELIRVSKEHGNV